LFAAGGRARDPAKPVFACSGRAVLVAAGLPAVRVSVRCPP
jgi:hypothetical protein